MTLYLAAFEHFATVYPHEAYAHWPEEFWRFFSRQCPEISREAMERILRETEE